MTFRFRMFTPDGDDLEDYVAARPDWNPGDTLYVAGEPMYRIVATVPMQDLDNEVFAGIWEVEPID